MKHAKRRTVRSRRTRRTRRTQRTRKQGGTYELTPNGKSVWKRNPQCPFAKGNWPPHDGCAEPLDIKDHTLNVGDRVDRFGSRFGYFLAPYIDGKPIPYTQRSMATFQSSHSNNPNIPCSNSYDEELKSGSLAYSIFKVVKPFTVKQCSAAPAFNQPGGGIQYRLFEGSVDTLDQPNITDKPDSSNKKIPNVHEMIELGYLVPDGNYPTPPW